jgi:D-alanine-D-alanine ligase-like ATP-grasp enzyme
MLDSVLEKGREVVVRKAANLHTGGSIHDVTEIVHPRLVEAAITAARAINIPVVGIDFMVRDPTDPSYVFIEANERPGLANHEPQPTAQRFSTSCSRCRATAPRARLWGRFDTDEHRYRPKIPS